MGYWAGIVGGATVGDRSLPPEKFQNPKPQDLTPAPDSGTLDGMETTTHLRNQITATIDHCRGLPADVVTEAVLKTITEHEKCAWCTK